MSNIDWDAAQENANKFKDYAPDGKHKVKCVDVEIKEVGTNGSVIQKFIFEEDNKYQYPSADHWLSFKNDNFRVWHQKCLLELLGSPEEKAKAVVEKVEESGDKSKIMKNYEAAFKLLLKKNPEVEIEVYTQSRNGKDYARAEFTDSSVAMPHNDEKKSDSSDSIASDSGDGEEIDLSMEDLPF